jgi:hypothetical protein
VLRLERAPATIGLSVIADGAASQLDCMRKHDMNRSQESREHVVWDAIGPALRMKPCPEKDLIHVDVAKAGDPTLVKKRRLQGPAAFTKRARKMLHGDVQGVRSERGPGMSLDGRHRGVALQPTETTRIAVPERDRVVAPPHSPQGMHVRLGHRLSRDDPNGTTHAQMHQEACARTRFKDQLLALAVQRKNHVTGSKGVLRRAWGAMQHVPPKHATIDHFRAENRGAQRASKTLDFREFRHA